MDKNMETALLSIRTETNTQAYMKKTKESQAKAHSLLKEE